MSLKKRVKVGKININMTNKWFYSFIALFVFILIGSFVVSQDSPSPGVEMPGGHNISEVSPPAGCGGGQVLEWDSSTGWDCRSIKSSPWKEEENCVGENTASCSAPTPNEILSPEECNDIAGCWYDKSILEGVCRKRSCSELFGSECEDTSGCYLSSDIYYDDGDVGSDKFCDDDLNNCFSAGDVNNAIQDPGCNDKRLLKYDQANNEWKCTGFTTTDIDNSIQDPGCGEGEILKYDSGSWECDAESSSFSPWTEESGGGISYDGDVGADKFCDDDMNNCFNPENVLASSGCSRGHTLYYNDLTGGWQCSTEQNNYWEKVSGGISTSNDLKLGVGDKVHAYEYCDTNGNNCLDTEEISTYKNERARCPRYRRQSDDVTGRSSLGVEPWQYNGVIGREGLSINSKDQNDPYNLGWGGCKENSDGTITIQNPVVYPGEAYMQSYLMDSGEYGARYSPGSASSPNSNGYYRVRSYISSAMKICEELGLDYSDDDVAWRASSIAYYSTTDYGWKSENLNSDVYILGNVECELP